MSLEGAVVHVSLEPSPSPSKCIVSFAVGPPVLVEFSSDLARQLPAFIMGTAPALHRHVNLFAALCCMSTVCSGVLAVPSCVCPHMPNPHLSCFSFWGLCWACSETMQSTLHVCVAHQQWPVQMSTLHCKELRLLSTE